VTQQVRQLTWTLADRPESFRFLIRDRDQRFTDGFDEVFRSTGLEVIRIPFRAPQANGAAERFVRTVRLECLDWLLILDAQHLERFLDVFVEHYNGHRPHRALALTPPQPTRPPVAPATERAEARIQRRDRLGGVVRHPLLRLGGGRSRQAHFIRMNIALTILQKKFKETPLLRIRCGYLDLRAFQGGMVSARAAVGE
jgi:putative transposase